MDLEKDSQPRQRNCISYYLTFRAKWVKEEVARLPTKFEIISVIADKNLVNLRKILLKNVHK